MYGYLPRHSPIIGPISRYLSNSPIYTPPRLARSLRSAAIRPLHGPCPSVSPRRPLRSPSRSARRLGRQSIYLPMSATAYPRTRTHTRHAICPLTSPSHPLRNPSSLGRRPSSVHVPSVNSPVQSQSFHRAPQSASHFSHFRLSRLFRPNWPPSRPGFPVI